MWMRRLNSAWNAWHRSVLTGAGGIACRVVAYIVLQCTAVGTRIHEGTNRRDIGEGHSGAENDFVLIERNLSGEADAVLALNAQKAMKSRDK